MFWIGLIAGATLAALALLPLSVMRATRQRARALAAERRALAAERMAEIGAMTGGLAHEIKNPLSTIGLNAQLLAEAVEDLDTEEDSQQVQGRLLRRVDVLRREAERLRDILGDFLRFAGAMRLDLVPTDLNTVVEELVDFYLPQAEHHGIRLTFDPGPGPMVAMIDAPHLKQALLNLLINAAQAMEQESASETPPRELMLRTRSVSTPEGPAWEVHVIDTGPGMTTETRERIFAPYYTTKSGGSGLGLPTTRRLVIEHGGQIEVHSEPGQGTDFVIRLPQHEA